MILGKSSKCRIFKTWVFLFYNLSSGVYVHSYALCKGNESQNNSPGDNLNVAKSRVVPKREVESVTYVSEH